MPMIPRSPSTFAAGIAPPQPRTPGLHGQRAGGLMAVARTMPRMPKPIKPVRPVTSRLAGTAMKHPVRLPKMR